MVEVYLEEKTTYKIPIYCITIADNDIEDNLTPNTLRKAYGVAHPKSKRKKSIHANLGTATYTVGCLPKGS